MASHYLHPIDNNFLILVIHSSSPLKTQILSLLLSSSPHPFHEGAEIHEPDQEAFEPVIDEGLKDPRLGNFQ